MAADRSADWSLADAPRQLRPQTRGRIVMGQSSRTDTSWAASPAPGRGSDVTSRRANRSAPGTPVPAGDTRGYHSTHRLSAERIHDKPKQSLFTSLGARRDRHFTARRNNHYTVRRNAIVTARSCATQESLHRATQLSLHCRRHAIRIVLERTYAGALKSIGSPFIDRKVSLTGLATLREKEVVKIRQVTSHVAKIKKQGAKLRHRDYLSLKIKKLLTYGIYRILWSISLESL